MFALAQALFQQGVEIFQRDIAQHGLCAQIIHGQKRNADQRGQGFLFAEMLGTKRLGKLIGGKKASGHLLLPKRLSALQPGDQVALLRVQGGGAFYILDQLGGEG